MAEYDPRCKWPFRYDIFGDIQVNIEISFNIILDV